MKPGLSSGLNPRDGPLRQDVVRDADVDLRDTVGS